MGVDGVCVCVGEGNGVEQGESSQNAIYTCLKLSKNLIKIKKNVFTMEGMICFQGSWYPHSPKD